MDTPTSDVMARAIELWEAEDVRDREAEERTFAEEALAELDIPPGYLEKARKELDEEAQKSRQMGRSRRTKVVIAVMGGLACLLLMQSFHPYAFTAWENSSSDFREWHVHVNMGTVAHLDRGSATHGLPSGGSIWLRVNGFSQPADDRYFANLRANDPPRTLWGRDEMTINVRGEGGLRATRVYLRSGSLERWRSPRIPLTSAWVEHRIPIDEFERQTGGRTAWEPAPWETPVGITMLQLKVGYSINDLESTGSLGLKSVRFE